MEYDDKTMALAKHLKVDPALIENNYSDYYTVNQRTIKDGKTPEEYKKLADDFRTLLDKEHQELVTEGIINGCKEVEVEEKTEKFGMIETTKKKRKLSEIAYEKVSEYLEPISERAKERAEQLERLNTRAWQPPIKETKEDIYNRLAKDNLYVTNILYFLLKADEYDYHSDRTNSLRRAWLGQPISDTRKDREVNDGEYLVLTDSEADDWEEEGLRSLFSDMTHGVEGFIRDYLDEDRFVEDHSGNRGENINGYDGNEDEVEFEETTYYIYRNN